MRVSPEQIRKTAKDIATSADQWTTAVTGMSQAPADAFGSDQVGMMIKNFHARTHGVSLQYYSEVGHCASDVGTTLAEVADLYADTEMDNAARAKAIQAEVAEVGEL